MNTELDQTMEQLFQKYLDIHTANIEEGNNPLAIAGILISHGLMLYKTVLSDQDYDSMVNVIFDSRDRVKSIKFDKRNLQ